MRLPSAIGAVPRRVARSLIRAYQIVLSPLLGPSCRFHPTCSSYALTSVERFGVVRGGWLAAKRIGRCHPWNPGGYDPVPAILPVGRKRTIRDGVHGSSVDDS